MEERNNVADLHVVREARKREKEESRLVWVCVCGCQEFNWYDKYGLRCAQCDKWNTPRPYTGGAA